MRAMPFYLLPVTQMLHVRVERNNLAFTVKSGFWTNYLRATLDIISILFDRPFD